MQMIRIVNAAKLYLRLIRECRKMKKILIPILCLLSSMAFAQDYDKISQAFKVGNVTDISAMFDVDIDCSLEGKEETLTKADAERKLRSFFLAHSPRGFSMVHKGVSQNDVHYIIGELATSTGDYRTTIYLHKSGNTYLIQSLEIEE